MDQKELLTFLRSDAAKTAASVARSSVPFRGEVIDVQGGLVRVRDEKGKDQGWAPTTAPYAPQVGDMIAGIRDAAGIIVYGALNNSSAAPNNTVSAYAPVHSPGLRGNPTAPTTRYDDRSDQIATTAHVKAVLETSPTISGANLTDDPTAPDQNITDAGSTKIANTNYVQSSLVGYATQAFVTSQGYITSSYLTANNYITSSYLTTNGYATQSYVSSNYLLLTGGTVTGNLTVNATLLVPASFRLKIGAGSGSASTFPAAGGALTAGQYIIVQDANGSDRKIPCYI